MIVKKQRSSVKRYVSNEFVTLLQDAGDPAGVVQNAEDLARERAGGLHQYRDLQSVPDSIQVVPLIISFPRPLVRL
jgi:hypothetical protein